MHANYGVDGVRRLTRIRLESPFDGKHLTLKHFANKLKSKVVLLLFVNSERDLKILHFFPRKIRVLVYLFVTDFSLFEYCWPQAFLRKFRKSLADGTGWYIDGKHATTTITSFPVHFRTSQKRLLFKAFAFFSSDLFRGLKSAHRACRVIDTSGNVVNRTGALARS